MHGRQFLERMEYHLDLSAGQKEEIGRIMRDSRAAGEAMREQMLPRIRELLEQSREEIFEVLTPEQQRKFERLMARHRRDAERLFLGHGPPGERRQRFKGRRAP
jgi:Spy/CpxP family protein refolding chaperone